MAQLTIYLDPETQRKVTAAAKREQQSMSAWARAQLSKAADDRPLSAGEHLRKFAGTFKDFEAPPRDPRHRPIPSLD
jgi:hypothetical protein